MGAKKKLLFAVALLAVLAAGFMFVLLEASKAFTYDEAHSLIQTSDGGYALTGETSYGHSDLWLAKTDASGNMLR